jgi:hypothetical protein
MRQHCCLRLAWDSQAGLSMATNHWQRSWFLIQRFCEAQLEQLRTVLHDLLQPVVVSTMIISARFPPENCLAAVLQLDICGFTDLSRTIPPMQLVLLMHVLRRDSVQTRARQDGHDRRRLHRRGPADGRAACQVSLPRMLKVEKTIQTTQRNDNFFQRTSNFFQKALKQQLFSEE